MPGVRNHRFDPKKMDIGHSISIVSSARYFHRQQRQTIAGRRLPFHRAARASQAQCSDLWVRAHPFLGIGYGAHQRQHMACHAQCQFVFAHVDLVNACPAQQLGILITVGSRQYLDARLQHPRDLDHADGL